MNHQTALLAISLALFTCNLTAAPTPQSDTVTESSTSTQDLVQQAKDLSQAAWGKTKKNTKQASDIIQKKSNEYYEIAKEKTGKTADIIAKKSKSYYKSAKETSKEYLEKASETAEDVTKTVKEKAGDYYKSTKKKAREMLESSEKPAGNTI